MAFTVSNFTSGLKHQGARASLFEVTITGGILVHAVEAEGEKPKVALDTGTIDDAMKFTCRATTIPGLTVTTIPVMYFWKRD